VSFKIRAFNEYIPQSLHRELLPQMLPVDGVPGLQKMSGVPMDSYESREALQFLVQVYKATEENLRQVLEQREKDREFIDARVSAYYQMNQDLGREISDSDYETIIGLRDSNNRVVMGPVNANFAQIDPAKKPVAKIPVYLQGPHVTLFGPPESAKMTINALNSYHRKLREEPEIVSEILALEEIRPFWGADDEDSKTPLHEDLLNAGKNLTQGFAKSLSLDEGEKKYRLAEDHLAQPLKRFPGLAMPSTFLFYNGQPIPLHIYDFALHVFHNFKHPERLAFYVPKLENEEEASYVAHLFRVTEDLIQQRWPDYTKGSLRCMIVLENPRAILRTHEIMDALFPYFVGASLGWHDFLASTARLFKNDGHYRIPVKADPDIVIKYIKASHELLAEVVGSRGGIKVGGMYGILPNSSDLFSESFQVTLKGYFRDVLTQMKRNLTGFWVAHPDFVRIGIALVIAWKKFQSGEKKYLNQLVAGLFKSPHKEEIEKFIVTSDLVGLDRNHPGFVRSLIVADIKESDFIANNHPDEVRYNVFQSLQYLTDWLAGRGCVALPTTVGGIPVRVMDDLATAERSRWEVWHEIQHRRFAKEELLKIAFEELRFIRLGLSTENKKVQVQWDEETSRWYPVALYLMLKLMTDEKPPEFATEYLLPFTTPIIREAKDPLITWLGLEPERYRLNREIERMFFLFECCGEIGFAQDLSQKAFLTEKDFLQRTRQFSEQEILQAASFHGDIGQRRGTLDPLAKKEQAQVQESSELEELRNLANEYLKKYGFKFLVSAQGRSASELLTVLKGRLNQPKNIEIENAQQALAHIAWKRFNQLVTEQDSAFPEFSIAAKTQALLYRSAVDRLQIAISQKTFSGQLSLVNISQSSFTQASSANTSESFFQIASLSKSVAALLSLKILRQKNHSAETKLQEIKEIPKTWALIRNQKGIEEVRIRHLLNHEAFNWHYVNGFAKDQQLPKAFEILQDPKKYGYAPLEILRSPGERFSYSGGGYLVLEALLEELTGQSVQILLKDFLKAHGLKNVFCNSDFKNQSDHAMGVLEHQKIVPGGFLQFPAFAAGFSSTAVDFLRFLQLLGDSLNDPRSELYDLILRALYAEDKGSMDFMNSKMGLGFFVSECGPNRLILHQGANDGFRALYVYCFEGPDKGLGLVTLANGDHAAVPVIAEAAKMIFQALKLKGFDAEVLNPGGSQTVFSQMVSQGLASEQVVNQGYKNLLFKGFQSQLPPVISRAESEFYEFSNSNILSQSRLNRVTNQRFARAENLVSNYRPNYDPELYCEQGKVMDSWESARHNPMDGDEVIFELAGAKSCRSVFVSTEFHLGNQSPKVQIFFQTLSLKNWQELIPDIQMNGHAWWAVVLDRPIEKICQVKVRMIPDGGLTRVLLLEEEISQNKPFKNGEVFTALAKNKPSVQYKHSIPQPKKPLSLAYTLTENKSSELWRQARVKNLASQALGARILRATNEHYGPARQVISPFPALHMFDGLESARSREIGHFEEVEIELAQENAVREIEFDFQYFVNNNPREISIEGFGPLGWQKLCENNFIKPFAGRRWVFRLRQPQVFSKLRVKTIPDGGINRIRVF
jgi:malate synthase